ncbi:hypothetical protein P2H89_23320 [Paraflavitalea sp. CAU 1676]|nr:hypothetical protein [Paraflavitalea sp. CAU 1676]
MTKSLSLLFLLCIGLKSVYCQQLDSLTGWRIYKLVDRTAYQASEDTLAHLDSRLLPHQAINTFVSKMIILNTDKPLSLNSAFLMSFLDVNSKPVKVIVSGGGDYIFVRRFQKYYAIPESIRQDWLEFLNEQYGILSKN